MRPTRSSGRKLAWPIASLWLAWAASSPLVAQSGHQPDALVRADEHLLARRWDAAAAAAREAVARGVAAPWLEEAYRQWIEALLRAGRVAEATRVASSFPAGAGQQARADLARRLGEIDEAEALYERAMEARPTARALLGLGRIEQVRSNLASARDHFEQAAALAPEDPEVLLALFESTPGDLRLEHGREYLERATYEDPRLLEAFSRRLRVLETVGDRAPCHASIPESATLPLRRSVHSPGQTALLVEVEVDGRRAKRALFDTGVGALLVVSGRLARRAGIEAIGEGLVRGIGERGTRGSRYGIAGRIALEGLVFEQCLIEIVDELPSVAIVGLAALSETLATVDGRRGELRLVRHPRAGSDRWGHDRGPVPVDGRTWIDALRLGGTLHLPGRVGEAGDERLYAVDSGSPRNLLALDVARSATKLRSAPAAISGLAGTVGVQHGGPVLLVVGPRSVRERVTWAIDLEPLDQWIGYRTGGVLGMPFLEEGALTIDLRNGRIGFPSE